MARIEAGDDIKPADWQRVARLQALDMVKVGDDFALEMAQRDEQFTQEFINQ